MLHDENCTCEKDYATKFLCDSCFSEYKVESDYLKNSVADENGERFRNEVEMHCIKGRRIAKQLQKDLDFLWQNELLTDETYETLTQCLNELSWNLFWTDKFDHGI